jgi:hypothetical protein
MALTDQSARVRLSRDERERTRLHLPEKGRKPAKWSHQAELDSLRGKQIKFQLVHMDDYDFRTATLLEADQFSIKISVDWLIRGQQSTMTYFKHQIAAFAAA